MRLSRIVCNKLASLINSYSNYNPSPLSLKKFTDFGKHAHKEDKKSEMAVQSYEFLKEELLVRLALMSKEMLYLPENLIKTSSVQQVYGWYLKSFEEMLGHKNSKPNDDELKK
jgi:pyruvate dehydrogenase kinase 2/3/4